MLSWRTGPVEMTPNLTPPSLDTPGPADLSPLNESTMDPRDLDERRFARMLAGRTCSRRDGISRPRSTKPVARPYSLGSIEFARRARTRSVTSNDTLRDTFERARRSIPCSTHALTAWIHAPRL
jgi:hypothetical protein